MSHHDVFEQPTVLLKYGYLRLSVFAMQTAGPAARTMAALYELADRRSRGMRVSIARIAALCGLPRRTVQRHLQFLERDFRGIESVQTRGASRYRIAKEVWDARSRFVAMPKWWTNVPDRFQDWSTTATYAWLLSRGCLVERLREADNSIDGRLIVTLQEIAQTTGLSRRSVSAAIGLLHTSFFITADPIRRPDPTFRFALQRLEMWFHDPLPKSRDNLSRSVTGHFWRSSCEENGALEREKMAHRSQ
jgi:biotin operon repressor